MEEATADSMDTGGRDRPVDDAASDSGSSSGSEGELQQQVAELEATLGESPYHYDSHVELIQLLRQLGDLDKARQARQRMSEIFPLTEELWLEWLSDELPLASLPEAMEELRTLFKRAMEDYLSVRLWLEYARFAVDRMSLVPEGMEFPRDVFEKAIIACGLHTSQAGLLWDAYREFETAVLSSLQQMQQSDPSDDSLKSQVEEQYERVDKLYRRQLAVPLIGMGSTFQEYSAFSEKTVTEEGMPAYTRARKKLEGYLPFENELQSSAPPTLDAYRSYLSHTKSSKDDPTFINTLYQRALAHHCLNTDLWKEYLTFLAQNFNRVKSVLLPGYQQAVRNCPWMVVFWVGYVRAQERMGVNHEEITATFERGLVGNFTEGKEYLQLWTAYCDYLRRRVGPEEEEGRGEPALVELRKTFKRARDELETYYGRDGDPTDSLSRYQARLEARYYGNMEEARSLWDDIMGRHGREAEYWLEYATIERYCGEVGLCHKLLQRAVNSASDDPEKVCQALLDFEREEGSLESYEEAVERCAAQMKRVQERREKAAEKETQRKDEKKQHKKTEKVQKKSTTKSDQSEQRAGPWKGGKRKRPQTAHVFFEEEEEEEERMSKRRKVAESHDAQPVVMETQPRTHREPAMTKQDVRGETTPTETTPTKPEEVDMEQEDRGGTAEVPGGEVGVGSKESRTAFVSNLIFAVTEEQIREKFSKCGVISDIRLIKTRGKMGKGNVYAYIEFSTPEPMQQALKLDRTLLDNRPMFVSPFKEKGSQAPSFKYTAMNNKATVFVTNIQHNVTESELEETFKQCGEIKEVRLVRNRAGRPKGFAYIEYCDEPSAITAVLKLDQQQVGLKKINVAISNPPKRQGESPWAIARSEILPKTQKPAATDVPFVRPSFVPERVRKQQETANPLARKSKTHISLVPRVVARREKEGGEGKGEGKGEGEPERQKMSNEDFRKLLFKS